MVFCVIVNSPERASSQPSCNRLGSGAVALLLSILHTSQGCLLLCCKGTRKHKYAWSMVHAMRSKQIQGALAAVSRRGPENCRLLEAWFQSEAQARRARDVQEVEAQQMAWCTELAACCAPSSFHPLCATGSLLAGVLPECDAQHPRHLGEDLQAMRVVVCGWEGGMLPVAAG